MKKTILLLALLTLNLAGCGITMGDPTNKAHTEVVRLATDEVKWISTDVKDSRSEVSLQASSYLISNRSRLLTRLSSLKKAAHEILQQQPILYRLTLTNLANETLARQSLRICPLEKNWMLLATWDKAHPYREGGWKIPGGDFYPENCITPLATTDSRIATGDEAAFCSGTGVICFDLADWVMSQVRERGRDYGFAITLEDNDGVQIYGDSSAYGPAIYWRKLRH